MYPIGMVTDRTMKKLLIILPLVVSLSACVGHIPEELSPMVLEGRTTVEATIESLLLGSDSRIWPEGAAIGVYGSVSGSTEKY